MVAAAWRSAPQLLPGRKLKDAHQSVPCLDFRLDLTAAGMERPSCYSLSRKLKDTLPEKVLSPVSPDRTAADGAALSYSQVEAEGYPSEKVLSALLHLTLTAADGAPSVTPRLRS